ncbi:hypothetical protein ETD83_35210 [Actinomadura soli]|uniref:Uncharacterized protein n=1 Tax=Actinomadura soli TaxID=2508997 RepID=A0A5C4J4H8_9ACTN|nr:hypothetical protein [Actinomadura soli]TMQ90491.1 hypothetical protein ETD83_35210 [Actinomadura soli]
MRIPKRVNTVLDWIEEHYLALGVVVALIAVALVATLAPRSVGIPVAAFILGLAAGGFTVHVRSSRRVARVRADVDNLLRENGALRHRNTVLASGVITREAQETQALMSIPEDDLPLAEGDAHGSDVTQATVTLDELMEGDPQSTDELPEEEVEEVIREDDPQRTTVLPTIPDDFADQKADRKAGQRNAANDSRRS